MPDNWPGVVISEPESPPDQTQWPGTAVPTLTIPQQILPLLKRPEFPRYEELHSQPALLKRLKASKSPDDAITVWEQHQVSEDVNQNLPHYVLGHQSWPLENLPPRLQTEIQGIRDDPKQRQLFELDDRIGILRGVSDAPSGELREGAGFIPFVAGLSEAATLLELRNSAVALESGEATPEQIDVVANHVLNSEKYKKELKSSPVGRRVKDIAKGLPAFLGEMALTGGIFTGARKIAKRGALKILGKTIARKTGARAAAGVAAGFSAQLAANPQWTARATMQQASSRAVGNLGSGEKKPTDIVSNLPAGVAGAGIELGSEMMGGPISKGLGLIGRGLAKAAGRPVGKAAGGATKAAGGGVFARAGKKVLFDGAVPEILEERVGEGATGTLSAIAPELVDGDFGVLGGLVEGGQGREDAINQLKAEAIVFGAMGSPGMVSGGIQSAAGLAGRVSAAVKSKRIEALTKSISEGKLSRSEWQRLTNKPKSEMPKTAEERFQDPVAQYVLRKAELIKAEPAKADLGTKPVDITRPTTRAELVRQGSVKPRKESMGPGLPTKREEQDESYERTLSNEDFAWSYLETPESRAVAQRIVDGKKWTPRDLVAADPELGAATQVSVQARRAFYNNLKKVLQNEDLGPAKAAGFASDVRPDGQWRMVSPDVASQLPTTPGLESRRVGRSTFVRYSIPDGSSAADFPTIRLTQPTERTKRSSRTVGMPGVRNMGSVATSEPGVEPAESSPASVGAPVQPRRAPWPHDPLGRHNDIAHSEMLRFMTELPDLKRLYLFNLMDSLGRDDNAERDFERIATISQTVGHWPSKADPSRTVGWAPPMSDVLMKMAARRRQQTEAGQEISDNVYDPDLLERQIEDILDPLPMEGAEQADPTESSLVSESVADPLDTADSIPRVSNDEFANGPWDMAHAGLMSEIVADKVAKGMKGIENRIYGIREHSPGEWQMVSRPDAPVDPGGSGSVVADPAAEPDFKLTGEPAPVKEQPPGFEDQGGRQRGLFGKQDDLPGQGTFFQEPGAEPSLQERQGAAQADPSPPTDLTPEQKRSVAAMLATNSLEATEKRLADGGYSDKIPFAREIDPLFTARDGFVPPAVTNLINNAAQADPPSVEPATEFLASQDRDLLPKKVRDKVDAAAPGQKVPPSTPELDNLTGDQRAIFDAIQAEINPLAPTEVVRSPKPRGRAKAKAKAKAKPKGKAKPKSARGQARAELADAYSELAKALKDLDSTTPTLVPLTSNITKALAKVAVALAKNGVVEFSGFVKGVANQFSPEIARKIGEHIETAWKMLKLTGEFKELGEVGSTSDVLDRLAADAKPAPASVPTVAQEPGTYDPDLNEQVVALGGSIETGLTREERKFRASVANKIGSISDPDLDHAIADAAFQIASEGKFDKNQPLAPYATSVARSRYADIKNPGREKTNVDAIEPAARPEKLAQEELDQDQRVEADEADEQIRRESQKLASLTPNAIGRMKLSVLREQKKIAARVATAAENEKNDLSVDADLRKAAQKLQRVTTKESIRDALQDFVREIQVAIGQDVDPLPVQPVGIKAGQAWEKKKGTGKLTVLKVSKDGQKITNTFGVPITPNELLKDYRLSDEDQKARKQPESEPVPGLAPDRTNHRKRVRKELTKAFGAESAKANMVVLDSFASTRTGAAVAEFWRTLTIRSGSVEGLSEFEGALFQNGVKPVWYSKLQNVIEEKIGGKVGFNQLMATLKKNGVSPSEMKWSNLEVLFEDRKSVPKAELQDWVAANGVKLEETVLGGDAPARIGQRSEIMELAVNDIREVLGRQNLLTDEVEEMADRWLDDSADMEAYDFLDDAMIDAGEPRMEAMLQQAEEHLPIIQERRRDTKYETWTLKGGKNYREVLVQLPRAQHTFDFPTFEDWEKTEITDDAIGDPMNRNVYNMERDDAERKAKLAVPRFTSSHWDQPNVVVHIRMADRIVDGKKVLHIEEIQSDWHQKGRKEGYRSPREIVAEELTVKRVPSAPKWVLVDVETGQKIGNRFASESSAQEAIRDLGFEGRYKAEKEQHDQWEISTPDGESSRIGVDLINTESAAREWGATNLRSHQERGITNKVPDAPFKKSWHELGMKRVFQEAVDGGYDSIVITPGKEQAKRYDLSQQVDNIDFRPVIRMETAEEADNRRGGLPTDVELTKGEFGWDAVKRDGTVLYREMGSRGGWKNPDIYWTREDAVRDVHRVLESRAGRKTDTYSTDRIEVAITLRETPEDDLKFEVKPDGTIFNPGGMATSMGLGGKQLEDVVGKAVARKIMADKKGRLSGEGLSIGGEGMVGFYDRILPQFVKKYGKKWGIAVGEGSVTTSQREDWTYKGPVRTVEEVREAIPRGDSVAVKNQLRQVASAMTVGHVFRSAMEEFGSIAAAEVMGGTMTYVAGTVPVHRIEVTDAMRDDIGRKGQPLFQSQESGPPMGAFQWDGTEQGQRIITAFETGNVRTLIHELGHLFRSWLTEEEQLTVDIEMGIAVEKQGVKKGRQISYPDGRTWTVENEEDFTEQLEEFFVSGPTNALSKGLTEVFQKIRKWLGQIYKHLDDHKAITLTPKMKEFFRDLFGGKQSTEKAAQTRAAGLEGVAVKKRNREQVVIDEIVKLYGDEFTDDQVRSALESAVEMLMDEYETNKERFNIVSAKFRAALRDEEKYEDIAALTKAGFDIDAVDWLHHFGEGGAGDVMGSQDSFGTENMSADANRDAQEAAKDFFREQPKDGPVKPTFESEDVRKSAEGLLDSWQEQGAPDQAADAVDEPWFDGSTTPEQSEMPEIDDTLAATEEWNEEWNDVSFEFGANVAEETDAERKRESDDQVNLGFGPGVAPPRNRADEFPAGEKLTPAEVLQRWGYSEEQQRRMTQSHGIVPPGLRDKAKAILTKLGHRLTRAQEHVPLKEKFAVFREFFRLLKDNLTIGSEMTNRRIVAITDELGPTHMRAFNLYLDLRNKLSAFEDGQAYGRHGFETREEVEDRLREAEKDIRFGRLMSLLNDGKRLKEAQAIVNKEAPTTAPIRRALLKREVERRKIVSEMVELGLLNDNALENDQYFHQQVASRMYDASVQAGRTAQRKTRTFQKKRVEDTGEAWDAELDYNTSYIESESAWMTEAHIEIRKEKLLRGLPNQMRRLKDEAKETNYRNLVGGQANVDRLAELRAEQQTMQDWVSGGQKLSSDEKQYRSQLSEEIAELDPSMPFRTRIAIAISQFLKARGISTSSDLMKELKLASANPSEAGNLEATLVYSAVRKRDDFIKDELGKKHETWETVLRNDPTLDSWQSRPGGLFYQAYTIPEHIAEALMAGEMADLDASQIRQVAVMAGQREPMILPVEVVAELDQMDKESADVRDLKVSDYSRGALTRWKAYTLMNPKKFLAYRFRNVTGDLDGVLTGAPVVLKFAWRAMKELWSYYSRKKLAMSTPLRMSLEYGVIGGSLNSTDLPSLKMIGEFRRFFEKDPSAWGRVKGLIGGYMDLVGKLNNWNEETLRYAAFLYYHEQLENGTLKNYGGARRSTVDALAKEMGNWVAAAHLARNLLGDYGNLTVMGQHMRAHLVPFWSYQEINMKRVPLLIANAVTRGSTGAKVGAAAAIPTWGLRLIIQSRIAAFTAAVLAWNEWVAPLLDDDDDDDKLDQEKKNPIYAKQSLHLNLGFTDDGSVVTLNNLGMLGDFGEWAGLQLMPELYRQYDDGQVTERQILEKMVWESPTNKMFQSLSPYYKLGQEQLMGKSLFPDWRNPRPIRRDESFTGTFGLTDEYKWVRGKVTGDGSRARPGYRFRAFGIGVSDPRANGLGMVYDVRERFLQSKGIEVSHPQKVSKFKQIRESAYFDDFQAFKEAKAKYIEGGGTYESFDRMLTSLLPKVPKKHQAEFIEFMNVEQKERYGEAKRYAAELQTKLFIWWKTAGESGYSNKKELDAKMGKLAETAASGGGRSDRARDAQTKLDGLKVSPSDQRMYLQAYKRDKERKQRRNGR